MKDNDSSSSLPFLDLMCCSFGGAILLFFVIVLLGESTSIKNEKIEKSNHQKDDLPWVLLLSSETGPLFQNEPTLTGWMPNGKSRYSLQQDHLAIYYDEPPTENTNLVVGSLVDNARFSLLILKQGEVIIDVQDLDYKTTPDSNKKDENRLVLWPWPTT